MRVRDHLLLSTGAAILLYPFLRGKTLIPLASSMLIDVDHYLWFVAKKRRVSLSEAVRYYNGANPPQHLGTRLLHFPPLLLALFLLGRRSRVARLALMGMAFHIGLDAFHLARMSAARTSALRRDQYTCQRCGAIAPDMVAHLWRQPAVLPSYSPDCMTSLCQRCHETVHAQGQANELITPLATVRPLRGAIPVAESKPTAVAAGRA